MSERAISKIIYKASAVATPEVWMDSTTATAQASDILAPKTAMLADGVMTEGTGTGGGGSTEQVLEHNLVVGHLVDSPSDGGVVRMYSYDSSYDSNRACSFITTGSGRYALDMTWEGITAYPIKLPSGCTKLTITVPNNNFKVTAFWVNTNEASTYGDLYAACVNDDDVSAWNGDIPNGDREINVPVDDEPNGVYINIYSSDNLITQALLSQVTVVATVPGEGGGYFDNITQDEEGYLVLDPYRPDQPYIFYDWLKGDGNAFIDTGLDASVYDADSYEKTTVFALTSFSVNYYPHIMGARNSWGNTGFYICGEMSASDTRFYVCLCNTEEVYTASSRDEIITVKMTDRKIYYNDTLVYTGMQDTISVQHAINIMLFTSAMYENGAVSYEDYRVNPPSPVKIYEFTVKDSQGNPIAHMVPAKRKADDILGMYDIVRDTFYTNVGSSGTFTIGND